MIPIMKNFIRFIEDKDIAIFGRFRRVTDQKAEMQRELIYKRIYQHDEYKAAVATATKKPDATAPKRFLPKPMHDALQAVRTGA